MNLFDELRTTADQLFTHERVIPDYFDEYRRGYIDGRIDLARRILKQIKNQVSFFAALKDEV